MLVLNKFPFFPKVMNTEPKKDLTDTRMLMEFIGEYYPLASIVVHS